MNLLSFHVIMASGMARGRVRKVSRTSELDIEITSWKMRAYDFYSRVE